MAIRIHLLLALCFLSLYNAHEYDPVKWAKKSPKIVGFSWSNCGPASDPIQIKSLTVSPSPIHVPGNVTVGTSFAFTSTGPSDIQVSIDMQKKGPFGIWIKVPCVSNVGSCSYSGLCADWATACPKYFEKYGIPCTCPIPANTYNIPDAVVDITKKLPSQADGEFHITANIVSPSAGHLGCLHLDVTLHG